MSMWTTLNCPLVPQHHLHQLMVLYPQYLHPNAIHECFPHLPRNITLISEADLQHLTPMDMVIARWPCQSHSRGRTSGGLEDPRSSILWDLIRLMQWWFFPPIYPSKVYFQQCTLVGRLSGQGIGRQSLCMSTPWRSHFCACREHWFLCPPASMDLDQPHTVIYFSCWFMPFIAKASWWPVVSSRDT